jgi:hypothetical protein
MGVVLLRKRFGSASLFKMWLFPPILSIIVWLYLLYLPDGLRMGKFDSLAGIGIFYGK